MIDIQNLSFLAYGTENDFIHKIHNFVVQHLGTEMATFELDFDIPFHFIADDLELQHKLLHCDVVNDDLTDDDGVNFAL